MHVVEVGLRGMDIGAVMTRMRTWLDHHQAEPVFFESAVLPGREVYFCCSSGARATHRRSPRLLMAVY